MSEATTVEQLAEMVKSLRERVEKIEALLKVDPSNFMWNIEDIVYKGLMEGHRRGMELPPHTHR